MQFLARDSSVGRAVDCRIFNGHPSVTGSTPVRETAKESFLITPAPNNWKRPHKHRLTLRVVYPAVKSQRTFAIDANTYT
jgi:hypothetical protein